MAVVRLRASLLNAFEFGMKEAFFGDVSLDAKSRLQIVIRIDVRILRIL